MSSELNQHNNSETRTQNSFSGSKLALISLLTVIAAVLITLFWGDTANLFGFRRLFGSSARSVAVPLSGSASVATAPTVKGQPDAATSGRVQSSMKTPVYFFGHGGPNIMYEVDHPAYLKLAQAGREITTKVKPKAVVVFSAHWQGGRNTIQVNTAEKTDLIYDFGGFPSHYYKEKYPHVGSKEVAGEVLRLLEEAKIPAEGVKRGLDHGVWVSFKCAFEPETNPLNVPIVQVSLFGSEDPDQHYRLGQAVASLREQNILIIVSGMAVHNLRDLRFAFGSSTPMPYAVSFDQALKDAVTTAPAERQKAMAELLKRPDARQAHPSFEHLLPIHIGAGAAGEDLGKRIWTLPEGSMSWAQYRFGEVGNASGL
ncbi:Extradiol ring-cleavage dioxygenase class III enzyme subunit B [Penicillium cf. griseofulvum]|uniref:Extradiol ring-cleavage dioxygenase class III enzyme subunit B n=1 Tax=Penicillium cf. griseofulvum TaxID=2972120 RepID=A0A9W9JCN6_9EURO|nr:Extradiol ring-cleavage dioxygenase class III enzyme subunit B [Penicillium cf. griseofulvum]KAJ5445598.1 Extradiol ring-cleavage dioxygenase class III enzyme subunit B [Penicillium cf. griseofulvum]KAJ5447319.1 Extradiol ring-cleavage dioxygenase class III enzyme subunit B [Penicillium cf. griseofulvum]